METGMLFVVTMVSTRVMPNYLYGVECLGVYDSIELAIERVKSFYIGEDQRSDDKMFSALCTKRRTSEIAEFKYRAWKDSSIPYDFPYNCDDVLITITKVVLNIDRFATA